MRLLDRYINSSIVKIFIATIFTFSFLYILIDVTSNLDEIIGRQIPFLILIKYYLSFLPIILVQTSSVACLIATLLTFSSLNNNNEIIVMRSSGLNFWQITKPALSFSLIISAFVFFLSEVYVPHASQTSQQIRNENFILKADRDEKKQNKITNLTFYGLRNRLYFVDSFNPNTNELNGITIIENDEHQNTKEKISALKGTWTGIAWKFFQVQSTTFSSDNTNAPIQVKIYKEKLMDIKETPQDFINQRLDVSSMNFLQLKNYIGRFANSGASRALNNLRVDLHQKLAYPFGAFVIVLVGLPLAMMVKNRKGMTFTTLGIAMLIGFLYYVINAVCLALGKGGLFPPIVSAWAAPFFFSSIALLTIKLNF